MIKRVFDLTVAALALLVLSPVLLGAALAVRLRMGSPVLFRQPRPGLNGQPFDLLKFRTMTDERDAEGRLLPDAERLTATGRFLRYTSLDELPELWNVLRGDMSLVGPRPLLMDYLPHYDAFQMRRHEVRPGITGWAQVNGRNDQSWQRRFELDVWYVEHRDIWLDLRILVITLWKVVKREGIAHEGEATMPAFAGPAGRQVMPGEETPQSVALAHEADLRAFGGGKGAALFDGRCSTLRRAPVDSGDRPEWTPDDELGRWHAAGASGHAAWRASDAGDDSRESAPRPPDTVRRATESRPRPRQ